MPLVRMIISAKPTAVSEAKDAFVNTIYFNVSGSVDPPNYQSLVDDLFTAWGLSPWGKGTYIDIRAYNMDDAEPRPVKAFKRELTGGARPDGVPQVALALSYFADRNLPRQRGRIFLGPWSTGTLRPTTAQITSVADFGITLGNIGGLNVDWSLWSPTTSTHTRINNVWCDDSWDIIRSRKILRTQRVTRTLNG